MPEPHLLAADADRAAVVIRLDASLADGRLTLAEYEDRAARAHAARTYGELAGLTADLPRPVPQPVRTRPERSPVTRAVYAGAWHGAWDRDLRTAWTGWATTAVLVVGIWLVSVLATGDLQYPWPVWVIGPWGVVLLARTVGERRSRDERGQLPA
ncbi:protein of unknown function [Geodermatophilus dictyosporus]|uniref:DUF1707 domain-containing protein n=1 Tax=Geodermatophilus dictyosporus TaxID=1523247 RepID=A0A1I5SC59_9ACTN|nr:DUF1707 domain-containing protein [Geodermatophilus dictyosporus]SFP68292.1 protein of unknown function [Geodermatophilus dictyosporus]